MSASAIAAGEEKYTNSRLRQALSSLAGTCVTVVGWHCSFASSEIRTRWSRCQCRSDRSGVVNCTASMATMNAVVEIVCHAMRNLSTACDCPDLPLTRSGLHLPVNVGSVLHNLSSRSAGESLGQTCLQEFLGTPLPQNFLGLRGPGVHGFIAQAVHQIRMSRHH